MADEQVQSVYDLLKSQYGVAVTFGENRQNTSLGTSSLKIANNDPRRVSLVIVNLSSNVVYVTPNSAAASTAGIRLNSSGGSVSMSWQSDFLMPSLEWHGIASGSSSQIYVIETLIRGKV